MLTFLFGAIAAYAIFLFVGTSMAPRLALRRHQRRLQAMQVADLASEALRCAEAAGIRKRFPEATIFDHQPAWTEAALAKALDELYASLAAEDQRLGERGTGSWVYFWYDFGLASLRELLEKRRAG